MEMEIGNRSSLLCKSHHQKLLQKYKTIACIIENLREEIQKKKEKCNNSTKIKIIKKKVKRSTLRKPTSSSLTPQNIIQV